MHVYYESSYYRSSSKEELIGFTEFLCEFKCALSIRFYND